ncbi:hypothetical protein PFAG_01709 [Plasmodium falciparum Santa Lucia]|uniref:tRNA-guanine(15) transglycosylase-like domain-containing protein n=1 Tax=Plasmodium falciparum Santa Lucia TaxID=478859 RepID=W7FSR3_PLAFA|nr:hypothetical protein PFAG_01709 [Plasmodium falciparum Santa Lucia]
MNDDKMMKSDKKHEQGSENLNMKSKNMIEELKKNLPQWAIQALEYADIESMKKGISQPENFSYLTEKCILFPTFPSTCTQKKKIKDYRKNLKLINIKKNKRARINLIVIKKKYLNDDNNNNNNNNNHNIYNSNNFCSGERVQKNTIILSPFFMPVGTKCCIKGLTLEDVNDICDYIILSNTYHLSNIYDMSIFEYNKDINNLIKFPNAMLTDSGGFQMVSLSKRIKILEEGILFNNIYNSEVIKKNIKACNVGDVVKKTYESVCSDMHNDNNNDNVVVRDNVVVFFFFFYIL